MKEDQTTITFYVSKELKATVTAVASVEDRTLSAVCRQALIAYLRGHEGLKPNGNGSAQHD